MEQKASMETVEQAASLAGRLLMESGAETYRVEDTVEYILKRYGCSEIAVLAFPTGAIFSFVDPSGQLRSRVIRTKSRATNLRVIDRVNTISRGITSGKLSPEEGLYALRNMRETSRQPLYLAVLSSGVSAGFFALLFTGGPFDFAVALFIGCLTRLLAQLFAGDGVSSAMYTLVSGAVTAGVALTAMRIFGMGSQYAIIIGAIMPLLPGLALTNAVRDTMRGDLIAGMARSTEALMSATMLAAGVAVVLML